MITVLVTGIVVTGFEWPGYKKIGPRHFVTAYRASAAGGSVFMAPSWNLPTLRGTRWTTAPGGWWRTSRPHRIAGFAALPALSVHVAQ